MHVQVGQLIRAEQYLEGTRLSRHGRKNHATGDVDSLLCLPRYGNPEDSDSGDDVDAGVAAGVDLHESDHGMNAAPSTFKPRPKMIKTAVAWRRQLAAWEAAQRAQSQRDDELGVDEDQNVSSNPNAFLEGPPTDPFFDHDATDFAGLPRGLKSWWSKSATLEILFGGSTSVLTLSDAKSMHASPRSSGTWSSWRTKRRINDRMKVASRLTITRHTKFNLVDIPENLISCDDTF